MIEYLVKQQWHGSCEHTGKDIYISYINNITCIILLSKLYASYIQEVSYSVSAVVRLCICIFYVAPHMNNYLLSLCDASSDLASKSRRVH